MKFFNFIRHHKALTSASVALVIMAIAVLVLSAMLSNGNAALAQSEMQVVAQAQEVTDLRNQVDTAQVQVAGLKRDKLALQGLSVIVANATIPGSASAGEINRAILFDTIANPSTIEVIISSTISGEERADVIVHNLQRLADGSDRSGMVTVFLRYLR